MSNWWDSAPVVAGASAKNWWESAPTVSTPPASAPAADPAPLQIKIKPQAPADPITQKVVAEQDAYRAAEAEAGIAPEDPYQRLMIQGATLGLADEALAGLSTPIEMIKRGTLNPVEAYNYAKARQDYDLDDARQRAGGWGTAAEIGGGVVSGGKLFEAGATLAPAVAQRLGGGLMGTAGGAAADGALYGGIAGAAEGSGWDRVNSGLTGAAFGGAVGGALPVAAAGVGVVASPIASNISARVNPQGYADRQLLRAAQESGQSADEIANRVAQAAAEGQPEYRLVDALDHAGRRRAYTVARNPGEGRQQMVEFLDQRQAGQGGRVGQAIEEGLGANETAEAAARRLAAARRTQDNAAFGALRNSADYVDVMPVANLIDSIVQPGMTTASGGPVAADSVEAVLGRARNMLERDGVSRIDFGTIQRTRNDIADAAEKAFRAGEGNKARLLRDVRSALDAQMEQASAGYREAMRNSAQAARTVDAVDAGSQGARRGRTENKLAAFNALTPEQQAAWRAGYADPLIERAQRSAMGTDAARPLTSLAARTELPAFAVPGQGGQMMRRLGRESDMFRTRATATGGSGTAENLAEDAAFGIDPTILGRLLAFDLPGAARNAVARGVAGVTGNTAPVRERLAERLLNGSPQEIRDLLMRLAAEAGQRSDRGAFALRSFLGGLTPEVVRSLSGPQPSP